eukprot:CAMPEP_0179447518 /NCGR_PEP_ID=MMETSP0799-20121207/31348_1 /TAXON_ID=46947 /ORGANISM="Geminigera cryophila, Strain CCMP2564" /LENGTH=43 /DNA_ID= /DNA_START= /DNA_END= /DNA_ORIENTATION=
MALKSAVSEGARLVEEEAKKANAPASSSGDNIPRTHVAHFWAK